MSWFHHSVRRALALLLVPLIASGAETHFEQQAKAEIQTWHTGQKIGLMIAPTFRFINQQPEACQAVLNDAHSPENLATACGLTDLTAHFIGSLYLDADSKALWQTLYTRLPATERQAFTGLLMGTTQDPESTKQFPSPLALAATHNPKLVQAVAAAEVTAEIQAGYDWLIGPLANRAQDLRWRFFDHTFGDVANNVEQLTEAWVLGAQGRKNGAVTGIIATMGLFPSAGSTVQGKHEGDVFTQDMDQFWQHQLSGFAGAIHAQTGAIQVGNHRINYVPALFGGDADLLNRLKNTTFHGQHFEGFLVSEPNGVALAQQAINQTGQASLTYSEAIARAVNAGVDLFIVDTFGPDYPQLNPTQFPEHTHLKTVFKAFEYAVRRGWIKEARLDDAVTRILAVKLAQQSAAKPTSTHSPKLSQQAAEQSLVLLKNRGLISNQPVIPLRHTDLQRVFVLDDRADAAAKTRLGLPAATAPRPQTAAETQAIGQALSSKLGTTVEFITNPERLTDETLNQHPAQSAAVFILSEDEPPTDRLITKQQNPLLKKFSLKQAYFARQFRSNGIPVISILLTTRPLILTEGGDQAPLLNSDAVLVAWTLTDATGPAVAAALFGDYRLKSHCFPPKDRQNCSNTLPVSWPLSAADINDGVALLFHSGFGLKT